MYKYIKILLENAELEDMANEIINDPGAKDVDLQNLLDKHKDNADMVSKIAQNANASPQTLMHAAGLLGDRSHEIFNNPAFPLHLLEDPNLFNTKLKNRVFGEETPEEKKYNDGLKALAQNHNIHPELQSVLYDNKDLRSYLAKNKNLHRNIANDLIYDKSSDRHNIVSNLLQNHTDPNFLNDVYEKNKKDTSGLIHRILVKNANLPSHLANKYVQHFLNNRKHVARDPYDTLGTALGHPSVKNPYGIMKDIFNRDRYERQFMNPRTTVHVLKNPNLSEKQIDELYELHKSVIEKHPEFYDYVLNNPSTSEKTKEKVLNDKKYTEEYYHEGY